MKFIEDGVRELLKARRVLCGSYIYGYYLEDDGYNKTIFEFMQVGHYPSKPLQFSLLIPLERIGGGDGKTERNDSETIP